MIGTREQRARKVAPSGKGDVRLWTMVFDRGEREVCVCEGRAGSRMQWVIECGGPILSCLGVPLLMVKRHSSQTLLRSIWDGSSCGRCGR